MKLTLSSAVCCLIVCAAIAPSAVPGQDNSGYSSMSGPPATVSFGPSASQPYANTNPQAANIVMRDTVGHAVDAPFGPQIRLDGQWGDGLGFTGDMYRVGTFLPWHLDPGTSLFFAAIDGGVSEDGTGVLNLTGGYRKYHEDRNRVESLFGGFDWDDTKTATFKRVVAGYQSLGKYVDFNVTGYHMVGKEYSDVIPRIENKIFFQNNILFTVDKLVESAYNLVDVETGGPIPLLGRYGVSGYAGAYYLWQNYDDQAIGWKIRVQSQLNENLAAGVRFTSDDVTGAQAWANVEMTFPAGKPNRWFRPLSVQQRLAQTIPRETRIPTNFHLKRLQKEVEINPATGLPYVVLHIDPDAPVNGDGRFERPFNSVANLMNRSEADIIFVNDGNRNNLVGVIPLFDDQRLLSSAFRHDFASANHGGFCPLPGFNPNDNKPILSNPGGNTVVTFNDNNEVNGFEIDGTNMTNGLFAMNVRDITLRNNCIENAVNGVNLQDIRGTALVTDNMFTNNSGTGFLLNNDDGNTLLLRFNRNVASMNGTGASITASNGSTIFISANNNNFDDNTAPNTGLNLTASGPNSLISVSNMQGNTFNRNNGNAIAINAIDNGGNVRINDFENNQVNNGLLNGINILLEGEDSRAKLDAASSDISNNLGAGVNVQLNDGRLSLIVGGPLATDGNTINNNLDAGINLELLRFSRASFVAQNNVITGTRNDPATNSIDAPNGDAIFIERQQGSLLTGPLDPVLGFNTALVSGNNLSNNRGNGINFFMAGADPSEPNQLNTNRPNGLNLVNNNMSLNRRNGMLTNGQANAVLVLNGSNNIVSNNSRNGFEFNLLNTAAIGNPVDGTQSVLDGTTVTNNVRNGFLIRTEFDSQTLLTLKSDTANTNISSNGRNGIQLLAPSNAPDMAINASITDIRIFGDTDGSIDSANFTTTIAGNGTTAGGNGIDIDVTDVARPFLTVDSTTIAGNLGDGAGNLGDGISVVSRGTASQPTIIIGGFNAIDITQTPLRPTMLGALNDGISVNHGVIIDANEGDGIQLFSAGASGIVLDVTESVIGSIGAGNGGHGVVLTSNGTNAPFMFARSQLLAEFSGTTIAGNDGHGVFINLTGAVGDRTFDNQNVFTFNRSLNPLLGTIRTLISTNGRDGINYVATPGDVTVEEVDDGMGGMVQNNYRQVLIPNIGMSNNPNPTSMMAPILVNPGTIAPFVDPLNPGVAVLPDFRFPFLDTRTVIDSVLTVTDSTIEFNGTNLTEGEGIFVNVGTNSYLGMEIRNNVFRGNNRADLRTQSFISETTPPPSYIDRGAMMNDELYLDHTAQIDLIFTGNTGNTLDVSRDGLNSVGVPNGQQARYTNMDLGKNPSAGAFGINDTMDRRLATVFRVRINEGSPATANTFISQGMMLDIMAAFDVPTVGGVSPTFLWEFGSPLDPLPDPAFP